MSVFSSVGCLYIESYLSVRILTEFLILEPRLNKVTFSGLNKSKASPFHLLVNALKKATNYYTFSVLVGTTAPSVTLIFKESL